MLINLLKSLIPQSFSEGSGKAIRNPYTGIESPPKVNQFCRLIGPITTLSFNEIG